MPATKRRRTIQASVAELWRTVGDPHHLAAWWPRVDRVEQVSAHAFTEVLPTKRGRPVRADFRLVELEAPRQVAWEQDVEGTPFERVLASARTSVRLEGHGDGTTDVLLELRQRMRGLSRLGSPLVWRAARRDLDAALDALQALHAPGAP